MSCNNSNSSIQIIQSGTNTIQISAPGPQGPPGPAGSGSGQIPFLRNTTHGGSTDTITEYQSIFNPANLVVLSSSIFIVEQNAEYYVLGDVYNSGSLVVSGTLHIDGGLYNSGSIVGPGIIE